MSHHASEMPEGMDHPFHKLMEEQRLGATGKFPHGKLGDGDEGEIALALATDLEKGVVRILFGKPIVWIGLTAKEAHDIAELLYKKSEELRLHEKKNKLLGQIEEAEDGPPPGYVAGGGADQR